ncbi:MAG: beta-ketoacyl-[acyl-carrier-protein] synthase family protein [Planctomycetota bacterium]|nr:MAG: beta-ketoacyl-[acyl-carrier-protein] synthase family protein [Planctomycetota bacterium]
MSRITDDQIVITGVGLVTPLGVGRERCWQAILGGQSALHWRRQRGIGQRSVPQRAQDAGVVDDEPQCEFAGNSVRGRANRVDTSTVAGEPPTATSAHAAPPAIIRSGSHTALRSTLPQQWSRGGFAAGGPLPPLGPALADIERCLAAGARRGMPVSAPEAKGRIAAGISERAGRGFGPWREVLCGAWPDRTVQAATVACAEALRDAALPLDLSRFGHRCGVILGTSKGGLARVQQLLRPGETAGPVRPTGATRRAAATGGRTDPRGDAWNAIWQSIGPQTAAECISELFRIQGPRTVPVAACATGLLAVAQAAQWLRQGICDVVICGSADASLCDSVLASFQRLGVLANRFEEPSRAVRPFDRSRTGFLVGEGAAVFVLEKLSTARTRKRRPYARWLAEGWATDPTGLTNMDASGSNLARLITDVLSRGGLAARDVDLIGFHGTATRANDLCETRAVKAALGPSAYRASGFSLKPAVGHLLGAAGSVELAATVLALRDHVVPPTLNLRHADPLCDLDYTPDRARPRRLRAALKLSLGFGGHLAVAAIGGWDEI